MGVRNRLQWERKGSDDTKKQISKVLGEESVRGLRDESEAILIFASGVCEVEGALSKVKKQVGVEEVRTDEFRFGQLGQFYKKNLKRPQHPKGSHQLSAGGHR